MRALWLAAMVGAGLLGCTLSRVDHARCDAHSDCREAFSASPCQLNDGDVQKLR